MRGSAHVTGTHHPHRRDHFTAVRACLGLVSAFQATASDEDLRRLARSRTGFQGSLTPYNDDAAHRPEVTVYPMESAAGHEPSEKTAAAPTAVLRACTAHVAQREDLPTILRLSRQRDIAALLRFPTWSAANHQAQAARLEWEARAAHTRRAAMATWWTATRWFTAGGLDRHLAPYASGRTRSIVTDAGMQVHVVPTIVVEGGAALGAFQEVARFRGNPAGGMVARRVVQLQAVEADLVQGPGGERRDSARGDPGAAGGREHPISDASNAVVEVEAAQRNPSKHLQAIAGDRPVTALLALPLQAVRIKPFPDLGLGGGTARVPTADLAVLVSGEKCWCVGWLPAA